MADARRADMKQAGASRIVCLVKENLGDEVNHFRQNYWSGEVFLDSELQFFKTIGGGALWNSAFGALVGMLQSPISSFFANINNFLTFHRSRAIMNFRGEGLIGGGCIVLDAKGSVVYSFLEKIPGEQPPLEEVISAVRTSCPSTKHM